MSVIDDALKANATIAGSQDRGPVKPPTPRVAIVTCMDPRLTSILQMLGLADGDADLIRNSGTVVNDDTIRSLIVSTRVLGAKEIMIVNHTDCGMLKFTDAEMENRLRSEVSQVPVAPARFYSFTDITENTKEQVYKARSHPWISVDVPIRGFVYDLSTGRFKEVVPDNRAVTG
jgi:carbonic anhydrase